MLVGAGFFLFWLWAKPLEKQRIVLLVRKEGNSNPEKNTLILESPIRELSIFFEAGSSKLEKESIHLLQAEWELNPISQIGYLSLIGSADASGHLTKNRKLVKDRVRNVESYLVSLGIPKDKINQTFLEPIYGKNPELRRLLRSVQIQYKIET
ncbi:cell envelope biogenesis protein OmpA [Leptospira perdikensis]|uniref:Cell envelope biogenesis protein OmpA n=2 Tax=Leptospira perdikensis TaxID=2484948 RepID=A0A4R9JFR1_9LEPT|nr:cell envelope biogenesis protein OmpA [Leptospira perdikensis]